MIRPRLLRRSRARCKLLTDARNETEGLPNAPDDLFPLGAGNGNDDPLRHQAQEEMAELANELNPSASEPFSSAVRENFPG